MPVVVQYEPRRHLLYANVCMPREVTSSDVNYSRVQTVRIGNRNGEFDYAPPFGSTKVDEVALRPKAFEVLAYWWSTTAGW